MVEGAQVIVVVPALNEAPRIGRVIGGMPAFVDHIVVVDDASTDDTAGAATATGDRRVVVVRHAVNRGVGAAIATGYLRALTIAGGPCDAFCVMAGDGQMSPDDLAAVALPVIRGACAYAKGDRFSRATSRARVPWARRVGGLTFSWLTARALGQPVHDSQCGYTALSRSAASRLDLRSLWPKYGYPNDLLGVLVARGMTFREVPVVAVYADEESKLRLRHLPGVGFVIARAFVRRVRTRPEPDEKLPKSRADTTYVAKCAPDPLR